MAYGLIMQANERVAASINRRSWLKSAGLVSAASFLSGTHSAAAEKTTPAKKVRGVIFMVSDGMSPGVLSLAEAYSQLTRQRTTQWWQLLNNPSATRGLMDNASANSLVTDSAAASSAWGGGQRVNNGSINVKPDGNEVTPIATLLRKKNAAIGLVTTATVTHATPAGFAASIAACWCGCKSCPPKPACNGRNGSSVPVAYPANDSITAKPKKGTVQLL